MKSIRAIMRHVLFSSFLLVWTLAFCPLLAVAAEEAQSPSEVVSEMMAKIKSAGSPAPFIEYVNWDSAFASAPESMKTQMKIETAAEMRSIFERMFADTKGFFEEQFRERLKSVPEEQRGLYEANLGKMTAAIEQQQAAMKEQIQSTEYTVGESSIDGEKATVTLTQSYEGQSKQREIELTKASGKWLLDSATIFANEPNQQATAPSAPASPAE